SRRPCRCAAGYWDSRSRSSGRSAIFPPCSPSPLQHTEQQLCHQLVQPLIRQAPCRKFIYVERHLLQLLRLGLAELAHETTQVRVRAMNFLEQALNLVMLAELANFLLHDLDRSHIAIHEIPGVCLRPIRM